MQGDEVNAAGFTSQKGGQGCFDEWNIESYRKNYRNDGLTMVFYG